MFGGYAHVISHTVARIKYQNCGPPALGKDSMYPNSYSSILIFVDVLAIGPRF